MCVSIIEILLFVTSPIHAQTLGVVDKTKKLNKFTRECRRRRRRRRRYHIIYIYMYTVCKIAGFRSSFLQLIPCDVNDIIDFQFFFSP